MVYGDQFTGKISIKDWPAYGKEGRAWVRSRPEPEDEGHPPQCFVCGKTLEQHVPTDTRSKNQKKKKKPQVLEYRYCLIPIKDHSLFCDEKYLWSAWARMMNKLYKRMAEDEALWARERERWLAR